MKNYSHIEESKITLLEKLQLKSKTTVINDNKIIESEYGLYPMSLPLNYLTYERKMTPKEAFHYLKGIGISERECKYYSNSHTVFNFDDNVHGYTMLKTDESMCGDNNEWEGEGYYLTHFLHHYKPTGKEDAWGNNVNIITEVIFSCHVTTENEDAYNDIVEPVSVIVRHYSSKWCDQVDIINNSDIFKAYSRCDEVVSLINPISFGGVHNEEVCELSFSGEGVVLNNNVFEPFGVDNIVKLNNDCYRGQLGLYILFNYNIIKLLNTISGNILNNDEYDALIKKHSGETELYIHNHKLFNSSKFCNDNKIFSLSLKINNKLYHLGMCLSNNKFVSEDVLCEIDLDFSLYIDGEVQENIIKFLKGEELLMLENNDTNTL